MAKPSSRILSDRSGNLPDLIRDRARCHYDVECIQSQPPEKKTSSNHLDVKKNMEKYRGKPMITDDIAKQRIIFVNDPKTLDQAYQILFRYFIMGLDAKICRNRGRKFLTYLILATSNEIILIDVLTIQRLPYVDQNIWIPLMKILNDQLKTKIGYEMAQKKKLIRDTLGGAFLQGVVDIKEAFRALELTEPQICKATDASCDGLRVLGKICYNLLDRQVPQSIYESYDQSPVSEEAKQLFVANAFVNFHAYVELTRRVMPRDIQSLLQGLLTEPRPEDFLRLSPEIYRSVAIVDTLDDYIEAASYLKNCDVIGFDSEWKPTYSAERQGRMAILQMASIEKVFIFDIIKLQSEITLGDWALLKSVFEDPNIVKLGFDLRDDSKLLKEFMGDVKMQSAKDLAIIMRAMEKLWPEVMRSNSRVFPVARGLSRLCNILLGRPLNKAKCLSMTNWEERPLKPQFIQYAALDAYCLVLCWNELLARLGGTNAEERLEHIVIAYNVETEAIRNA